MRYGKRGKTCNSLGGVAEGFWLCHNKICLIPHRDLQYSYNFPSLAVNWQSIFYSSPSYSVGDDRSPSVPPWKPCDPSSILHPPYPGHKKMTSPLERLQDQEKPWQCSVLLLTHRKRLEHKRSLGRNTRRTELYCQNEDSPNSLTLRIFVSAHVVTWVTALGMFSNLSLVLLLLPAVSLVSKFHFQLTKKR